MGLSRIFTMPKVPLALSGPLRLAKKLSNPPRQPRTKPLIFIYLVV